MTIDRRQLITGGAALIGLAACGKPDAGEPKLTVVLLGQALIEHAPFAAEWPGRDGVVSRLRGADAVFTNLETVILGDRAEAPTRELLTLHAAGPDVLQTLKGVGVSLLTTANNHAFDLGGGGILDTVAAVRSAGLASAGSGADLATASAPAFVTTPHGRVAVVGFATGKVREGGAATPTRPGVNELRRDPDGAPNREDEARIQTAIAAAADDADLVIACHHNHDWEPDNAQVPAWQQALARRCVDAGADVFAGHGSPVPQGMSVHRGRPLMFGLGNFVFQTEKVAGSYPPEAWAGIMARVRRRADGGLDATLDAIAMNETGLAGSDDLATRGFPSLASDNQAAAILERIDRLSRPLGGRVVRTSDGGRLEALP